MQDTYTRRDNSTPIYHKICFFNDLTNYGTFLFSDHLSEGWGYAFSLTSSPPLKWDRGYGVRRQPLAAFSFPEHAPQNVLMYILEVNNVLFRAFIWKPLGGISFILHTCIPQGLNMFFWGAIILWLTFWPTSLSQHRN